MVSADLAFPDTGALAAVEYGQLAVWAHSRLLSGLGAASTATGRCISASSTVDLFSFLILAFVLSLVSCVYTLSSFPPKPPKSVRWFSLCF